MLCTNGFVDDIMFAYKEENRPNLRRRVYVAPVRDEAAPVGRQTTLFGRDR